MRPVTRIRAFGLLFSLVLSGAGAQSPQPPAGPAAEVATHDAPVTFKTKVNLVSVPVVVRDAKGRATGNLSREDFQIFDNGKPQTISKFSVEKFGESAPAPAEAPAAAPKSPMPERFVAFFFDDMNLKFTDLAQARNAAWRYMQTSIRPSERVAIATTSGLTTLDFTDDRDKLHQTLLAIRAQAAISQPNVDCPPMTVYKADLIVNKSDALALAAAVAETKVCTGTQMSDDEAAFVATNFAKMQLNLADRYIRNVLGTLDGVIRKMSLMAGQRTIILVSSGFQVLDDRRQDEAAVLEKALRASIVVNALDARGLFAAIPGGDASERTLTTDTLIAKSAYASQEAMANREVMAETAEATGGRFFENSNDLDGGFASIAAAPEYLYVLGFNPQDLKLDGKYHSLKVTIRNSRGVAIEARRGYYPPRYANDPGEQAKAEVEEAFFARDETHDIPVVMQTQFFKNADGEATLTVAAKVDLRRIPFRKEEGRNRNDLTVVAGLFDSDGNYVSGTQKVVVMRLREETLESRLSSGVTVRSTFTVAPGTYLVRLVVRDAEGQMMAAQSGTVEIP